MLCTVIVAICSQSYKQRINALCGLNVGFVSIETDEASKGYVAYLDLTWC